MKRYIRASGDSWVSKDILSNSLDNGTFEDIWKKYLSWAEDVVNCERKINVYVSKSTGVTISDSRDLSIYAKNPDIHISYQDWCKNEYELALESNSVEEYKEKYENFIFWFLIEHGWKTW